MHAMANLHVRDIDDDLYTTLRTRAARDRRSISQEVVHIIERYLARPESPTEAGEEFLALIGSWDDQRPAHEIVADVRARRVASTRFDNAHELFD